jgi:hypothetical protein
MLQPSHQRRQRRPGPWSLAAATLTAFLAAGFDGATTGTLMYLILIIILLLSEMIQNAFKNDCNDSDGSI